MNREDKLANWQVKTNLKVEDVAYHQAKANGTRLGVIDALRKKNKKKTIPCNGEKQAQEPSTCKVYTKEEIENLEKSR